MDFVDIYISIFLFGSEYVISKFCVPFNGTHGNLQCLVTCLIHFSRPEKVKKEVSIVFYVDVVLICFVSFILVAFNRYLHCSAIYYFVLRH